MLKVWLVQWFYLYICVKHQTVWGVIFQKLPNNWDILKKRISATLLIISFCSVWLTKSLTLVIFYWSRVSLFSIICVIVVLLYVPMFTGSFINAAKNFFRERQTSLLIFYQYFNLSYPIFEWLSVSQIQVIYTLNTSKSTHKINFLKQDRLYSIEKPNKFLS